MTRMTPPKLMTMMRAGCPKGADCECAAGIQERLDAGESQQAIMSDYTPDIGLGDIIMLALGAILMDRVRITTLDVDEGARDEPVKSTFDVSSLLDDVPAPTDASAEESLVAA